METLEEAASRLTYHEALSWENTLSERCFIAGAQWQQDRMYSEEDIINALHSIELRYNRDFTIIYKGMKEWFNEFKKL